MNEYKRLDEGAWGQFGRKLLKGKDKSLEEQKEFLAACKSGKDGFLRHLKHKKLPDSASDGELVNFTRKFTEQEFIRPPYDIQEKIWQAFKRLPDEIAYKCGFWGYVIIKMIENDQIKPLFLASDSNNPNRTGIYMIDDALTSDDAGKIGGCVRRVLRSICNPAPSGKKIVFNDFPLGKAYWRWRWADKMSNIMEPKLILEILDQKYYVRFSEKMHSGKSYISSENIFGGLLLFLQNNREINREKLTEIIDQIGYLSVWKAIEVQTPQSNQKEIEKIAERL